MTDTLLIFPCGMPESLKQRDRARLQGQTIIGASSLDFDPAATGYDVWEKLPYVHEDGFMDAFVDLLDRHGIGTVFAPHDVIGSVLTARLPTLRPAVRLLNNFPWKSAELDYEVLHHRGAEIEAACDWLPTGPGTRPRLAGAHLNGTLRLVDSISGMCDNDKIAALIEVFRDVPEGDIVEIGSWWGRSAALLLLLSRHYGLGPVLCLDPWSEEGMSQGVEALDKVSASLSVDRAFSIFRCNMAPLSNGRLNYIRKAAHAAAEDYRPGLRLSTDLGETAYTGEIALLHIDGNHVYENVVLDETLWTPHVRSGGYIVFDDYVWPFGDGPQRVGDAYLAAHADRIAHSFVMGTSLFIKLA